MVWSRSWSQAVRSRLTRFARPAAVLGALLGASSIAPETAHAASVFIPAPDRVDFAYDSNYGLAYISSSSQILRYRPSDGTFLAPWSVGGAVSGIDLNMTTRTLAVADRQLTSNGQGRVVLISVDTGLQRSITYTPVANETGSFSVAFDDNNMVYFSPAGSGTELGPLRRASSATVSGSGPVEILPSATVDSGTVLTASPNRRTIAFAESGGIGNWGTISTWNPSVARYNVAQSAALRNFGVAPETSGRSFLVRESFSQLRSNTNTLIQSFGGGGTQCPAGVALGANGGIFYAPWQQSNQIFIYAPVGSTNVPFEQVGRITATNNFGTATGPYQSGHARVSSNSHTLLASVPGGVELFSVNGQYEANTQYVTTDEDTPITFDALFPNAWTGAEHYYYDVARQPSRGTLSGALTEHTGTNITYTPKLNANGQDSFTVSVNYPSSASGTTTRYTTVYVNITPVNDAPRSDTYYRTIYNNQPIEFKLPATDVDAYDYNGSPATAPNLPVNLTIRIITPPQIGTITPISTPTANVRYTPPSPAYVGTVNFTFVVSDGILESPVTNATLNLTGNFPLANYDYYRSTSQTQFSAAAPGPLSNDTTRTPGTILKFSIYSQPTYGTVTATENGAFTWTAPTPGTVPPPANGNVIFQYRAFDSTGYSNPTPIVVDIRPYPKADSQSVTLEEDTTKAITLTGSGNPNNTLFYTIIRQPLHGTLSGVAPNLVYTPHSNYNGSDIITFTVRSGSETSQPALVTINVTPVADPVSVAPLTVNLDEDSEQAFVLPLTDVDNRATIRLVTQPQHGTITGTAPNLTYKPNTSFNGTDTLEWAADFDGESLPATVTFNVTAINDAPTATDQSLETEQGTAKPFTLSASDVDGDTLVYTITTPPTHGTLSGTAPELTYTPNAGYYGTDTFSYSASDGTANATATVNFTITRVNHAPVATNGTLTVDEDVPGDLTLNATDVDNDELTYEIVSAPEHGTLSGTAPNLHYTPAAHFHGTDSFTFRSADVFEVSNTATVSITVNAVNDVPTTANQNVAVSEDTEKPFTLNVADADGDELTYETITAPTHGTLEGEGKDRVYTPAANFNGTDTFTYTVSDPSGATAQATVTFEVSSANDAPTGATQSINLNEDTAKPFVLAGNDPDGDALTYTIVDTPLHGTLSGTGANRIYTPDANWYGVDSINYRVSDASASSPVYEVTFNVASVNDVPFASGQSVTTAEDTAKPIVLSGSDVEGEALTYTIVNGPAHGTLSGTAPNLTYTPATNYTGADSFTFTAEDASGGVSAPATVSINVTAVNDLPIAGGFTVNLDEDTPTPFTLDGFDADGDELTYRITGLSGGNLSGTGANRTLTPPRDYNGTITLSYTVSDAYGESARATVTFVIAPVNDLPAIVRPGESTLGEGSSFGFIGTVYVKDVDGDILTVSLTLPPTHGTINLSTQPSGQPFISYLPSDTDYHGTDYFELQYTDGHGSVTLPFTLTYLPVNDAPHIWGYVTSVEEDGTKGYSPHSTDVENDPVTFSIVTAPQHGTASVSPDGRIIIYVPAPNYSGPDSFTYRGFDGAAYSTVASANITVTPVNDKPVAADQSLATDEDTAKPITLSGSDVEGSTLTYSIVTGPANGTLSGTAPNLTYTPNVNFNGTDSFTFRVNDGGLNSDPATVFIDVASVNDAPTASAQSVTATEDAAKPIVLSGSDPEGSTLTYTIVANPTKGTLSGTAPNLTYTPNANVSGTDSFTFQVSDGSQTSSTVTVNITINAVNDAPVATPQNVSATAGIAKAITLAGTDIEGSALTYTIVANPAKGTLSGTGANRTYTPNANASGTDSFTFKVNDGQLDSAVVTVSIAITPVAISPYSVKYIITNQWSGGFTADVQITNVSGAKINGWALKWNFPGNQQISNLWNGNKTQSGNAVTVTDANWNKVIQTGGTATIGFQASFSGTNAKPTSFTLNGVNCTVVP